MLSNVKAPLVYTKVLVRNWQSFVRLGTHKISAPTSFHTTVKLDYPVSLGGYKFPRRPTEPMVLHLVHVPVEPRQGHDMRTQARIGRGKLLGTTFADFERAIRSDLDRMLGKGGFDAGRDILAITVNRWSHGYSYTPSSLSTMWSDMQAQDRRCRAKVGNIAFANSDTAWDAYAHSAMSEGRARRRRTARRGPDRGRAALVHALPAPILQAVNRNRAARVGCRRHPALVSRWISRDMGAKKNQRWRCFPCRTC